MNRLHRWYCKSSHWEDTVRNGILPWALAEINLGESVLEVGPGSGVTTDWLMHRADHLDCLEIDPALADTLKRRYLMTNVNVQCGDAAATPYEDCHFTSVLSFTMLHHIRNAELQDRFFREAYRVLRAGGILAGVDSLPSILMSAFHLGDTLTLVPPDTLPLRLMSAGFTDVRVDIGPGRFRFSASRPFDPDNRAGTHFHSAIDSPDR